MYKPPDDLTKQTLKEDLNFEPTDEQTDEPADDDESAKMALAAASQSESKKEGPIPYSMIPESPYTQKRVNPARNHKRLMIVLAIIAACVMGSIFMATKFFGMKSGAEIAPRLIESPSVAEMNELSGWRYGFMLLGGDGIRFKTNKPVKWKDSDKYTKVVSTDALFQEKFDFVMNFWPGEQAELLKHKDQIEIFFKDFRAILHDKTNNLYLVYDEHG